LRSVAPDSIMAQMYRCSAGRAQPAELIGIDELKPALDTP
jgi:hypothetical protein